MHCLYCDRPLALLKRLTGDGEFCSKEHRKIYQKEHNELALARLLAVQTNSTSKEKRPNDRRNNKLAQAPPAPVKQPEGVQPGHAGFISEFLGEGSAISGAHVHPSTEGPRFRSGAPVL